MAVEYRLTLAGEHSPEDVAACAVPDPVERPRPSTVSRFLVSNLYEQHGFSLDVGTEVGGYYDATDDNGDVWEWETDQSLIVGFSMGKGDIVEKGIPDMLCMVSRILSSCPDDAALVQTDGGLLLTRMSGILRKHNRATWWDHYKFADAIIAM
jgi:hypothetical protein